MARPTKLTPELQEKVCEILASTSATLVGACASVGIEYETLRRWRARGMIEASGPYHAFCAAVARAQAKSEIPLAAAVAKFAREDWRAAAWILEHRFPEEWGSQVTVIRRFQDMSDDELDRYIASRIGGAEPAPEDSAGAPAGAATGQVDREP